MALLVVVQSHPVGAVTENDPVPPAAATFCDVFASVYEHETPACVTANVWPPMVSVAVRALVVPLAATLNPTVADPEPLAADVSVSQAALLLAVHPQALAVDRATDPVPPVAATAWDAADNE